MIVGIVGSEKQGEYKQSISKLLDRILAKYPDADFIVGDNEGVETEVANQLFKRDIDFMVLAILFEYEHSQANVTLYGHSTDIAELSDYVVVLTDGNCSRRLNAIKKQANKYLEINYKTGQEKWY